MRINLALKARYRLQEKEIDRLLDWIVAVDPANAAALDAALVRAPKAIRTLHANLQNHGRVRVFLMAIQKGGVERGTTMPATVTKAVEVGRSEVSDNGARPSAAAELETARRSGAAVAEEARVAEPGDEDDQLLAAYQHLLGGRGR